MSHVVSFNEILKSSAFARSAKQLLKKKPHLAASLRTALEISFVEESGNEAILLEAVGTHDEVY